MPSGQETEWGYSTAVGPTLGHTIKKFSQRGTNNIKGMYNCHFKKCTKLHIH